MNEIQEINDFVLLKKGDRIRRYIDGTNFKDGTVTLGTKIGCSGCFVTYDDGVHDICIPEELTKLKCKPKRPAHTI